MAGGWLAGWLRRWLLELLPVHGAVQQPLCVEVAAGSKPPTCCTPIPVAWCSHSSPLPPFPPSSLWPARVDLLVRAHVSPNFFLLGLLFQSIDLMWPKGLGDVILVLDERDQVVHHMLPHWVKVRGGSTGRRSWRGFRAG